MANIYDGNGNMISVSEASSRGVNTDTLPVIRITSDTLYENVTKETTSYGTVEIEGCGDNISCPISFKLQGSGSLSYAKHNFNITFFTDNTYVTKAKYQFKDWYKTNKIHVKANEYDYSMVRNSVGTRLAYTMIGKHLPKGARGYIDSFPCVLFYNGDYKGCYTINLAQDGKTYSFTNEAELAATNLAYRCKVYNSTWTNASNWEYRGDADENSTMQSAFATIHSLMANPTNLTKADISTHFDVESLIGYLTICQIGLCVDSLVNNWTIVTWDGVIWYHVFYDLDICFGIGGGQDGKNLPYNMDVFSSVQGGLNTFFAKVKSLYSSEIGAMYVRLRNNGITAESVYNTFKEFQDKWGYENIVADRTIWANDKQGTSDINLGWIENRFEYLDTLYNYNL